MKFLHFANVTNFKFKNVKVESDIWISNTVYMDYNLFSLGLECLPAVNLPSGCFCTNGPTPSPYLPLTDLLSLVAKKGVNRSQVVLDVTKEFHSWKVSEDNIDLTAAFVNDLNQNGQKNDEGKQNSNQPRLVPYTIQVVYNCKYL